MDTNTLVVGQEVRMVSGGFMYIKGKVSKITPEGVEVLVGPTSTGLDGLYHFDRVGKGRDYEGTYEGGPWELIQS